MQSSVAIAVVGATGQLGVELVKAGAQRGLHIIALGHDQIEVTDPKSVARAIEDCQPHHVVNTVAFTDVERCEDEPLRAMKVNALGAGYVAQAAARVGAQITFISTDCVFDGAKRFPVSGLACPASSYQEDDSTHPISVYGVSKLDGEHLSLGAQSEALVARLGILFGATGARGKGGANFIELILRRAREASEPVRVVADQWISPMYARDAAEALLDVLEEPASGIIHIANAGVCTWFDLAEKALQLLGMRTRIEPIPARVFLRKAARPANSGLFCGRLEAIRGTSMRPWQDALKAYLVEKGYIS